MGVYAHSASNTEAAVALHCSGRQAKLVKVANGHFPRGPWLDGQDALRVVKGLVEKRAVFFSRNERD